MDILEIDPDHPQYPELLKQIADPPSKLFVWGNPDILSSEMLAIVGTRKPTDYGIRVTAYLANGLKSVLVISSGLAYGIDSVALAEAVNGGRGAVAVIGSGLDRESFYPASNWQLAEKIVRQGGAIISEYAAGTPPLKHHFPARNRIIAGLARGVLVVEAGEGSGALITADFALEAGREVFAVAGNIFSPQTIGSNKMIKEGAQLVIGPEDILNCLGILPLAAQSSLLKELMPEEQAIINILNESAAGLSVDEIKIMVQLDTAKVSSTLTMMEIKGMIKNVGAGKFTCLTR